MSSSFPATVSARRRALFAFRMLACWSELGQASAVPDENKAPRGARTGAVFDSAGIGLL
jgi:hypothetical protein